MDGMEMGRCTFGRLKWKLTDDSSNPQRKNLALQLYGLIFTLAACLVVSPSIQHHLRMVKYCNYVKKCKFIMLCGSDVDYFSDFHN